MLQWLRNINFRYRVVTLTAVNIWLLLSFVTIFGFAQANLQGNNKPFKTDARAASMNSTKAEPGNGVTKVVHKLSGSAATGKNAVEVAFLVPLAIVLTGWGIVMIWQHHILSNLFSKIPVLAVVEDPAEPGSQTPKTNRPPASQPKGFAVFLAKFRSRPKS